MRIPLLDWYSFSHFTKIQIFKFLFLEFSKVMVATGFTSSGSSNSVEIVDFLSTSTQCQNFPNFPRLTTVARGELDNNGNPIVCGGFPSDDKSSTNQCETFLNGSWVSCQPMTESRTEFSFIKFPVVNDSVSLFLTGSYSPLLDSAEFLVNGKWERWSVPLPVKIGSHCMVMLNSTAFILIGGKQDDEVFSKRSHIFDITNQKWSDGPKLLTARVAPNCARIPTNNQSSEYSIIVVGGFNGMDLSSVELLDEGSNEWRKGPKLPYPIYGAAIVEHPLGGVALIGGRDGINKIENIYHLQHGGNNAQWELLPQKLRVARQEHTAFLVPDELADYCEN